MLNSSVTNSPTVNSPKVKMYTTTWCGDCQITKQALNRLGVTFEEVNIENDAEAANHVMQVNHGRRSVPTLVYNGDAASLSGFTRAKLDAFLNKHKLLEPVNR